MRLPMLSLLPFAICSFSAAADVTWRCEDPQWMGSPAIERGLFSAALGSDCRFRGVPKEGLAQLLAFIRNDIEHSGKVTIHAGPMAARREGLRGFRYDLTDELKEDGAPIVVRQDMFLGADDSRFLYLTQSTKVEGKGNAGYLQNVGFRTDIIHLEADRFLVRFENEVGIERPWFAFNFLFKAVGKGITRDKFLLARERLIRYLAPHLG